MSNAYRSLVLAANPVAYWRLGESAGATIAGDETGHGHEGTYLLNPDLGQAGAIAGDTNTCVVLEGKSYIEIHDDPVLSQPTSSAGLTVEAWVRFDNLDFQQEYIHWLGKGEAGKHEWAFRVYSSRDTKKPKRVCAYIWNPIGGEGAGAYIPGDEIEPGQWMHVVGCYQPGDANVPEAGVQIYKNGQLRQGPPAGATLYNHPPCWTIYPAHGNAPVRLGTRDKAGFLVGGLDEVAIYPCVLSAEEIRLHYETGIELR